jgi:hypothetical protein
MRVGVACSPPYRYPWSADTYVHPSRHGSTLGPRGFAAESTQREPLARPEEERRATARRNILPAAVVTASPAPAS